MSEHIERSSHLSYLCQYNLVTTTVRLEVHELFGFCFVFFGQTESEMWSEYTINVRKILLPCFGDTDRLGLQR